MVRRRRSAIPLEASSRGFAELPPALAVKILRAVLRPPPAPRPRGRISPPAPRSSGGWGSRPAGGGEAPQISPPIPRLPPPGGRSASSEDPVWIPWNKKRQAFRSVFIWLCCRKLHSPPSKAEAPRSMSCSERYLRRTQDHYSRVLPLCQDIFFPRGSARYSLQLTAPRYRSGCSAVAPPEQNALALTKF